MPEGRPVLLTVDDDVSVSRAVARDLRRRYGEHYRVVRARGPGAGARRAAGGEAPRRPGRRDPRRLPHAGAQRDRVPRAGDGSLPTGSAGPAHRLRRHRRRHRRDQRRRRRPLPAQAVGPARGEALPGRRRDAGDVAGPGRRAGPRRPGGRAPVVRAVARGPRLPGPQLRSLPLVDGGRRRGPPPAGRRRRRRRRDPAGRDPRRNDAQHAQHDRARPGRGPDRPPPRPTSTTSSSSAAGRPGWVPPCTPRPRACGPCSWSGRPPAARPGRARGSRTTSASRTASPAVNSPSGRAGRRRSSAPRCSRRGWSSGSRPAVPPASSASTTAVRSRRTPSCSPRASPTAGWMRPASTSSSAPASTTARRPPSSRPARTRTSSSSGARTRRARRRSSSRGWPGR